MTAHPESVVGRLRAAHSEHEHQRLHGLKEHIAAHERCLVCTLLAAFVEALDILGPVGEEPHPLDDSRADRIREAFAPLFLAPETPSHD